MAQEIKLFGNVDNLQFTTADGGSPESLTFVQGDGLRFSFALCEIRDGEAVIRNDIGIRTLRASIGRVFAEPTGGKATIKYDAGPPGGPIILMSDIAPTMDGAAFQTASPGLASSLQGNISLLGPAEWKIPLNLAATEPAPNFFVGSGGNSLTPRSFVRIRPISNGIFWDVEIKFIQSPWAFSETWSRVLSAPPSVKSIADGTPGDGITEAAANAVQSITVPPDFQGTYRVKYALKTSEIIGTSFTPSQIEDALNGMYSDGIKRFKVTNPDINQAYVEFVGPLGSLAQDLMSIEVKTFQPGTPIIELSLDTVELDAALRGAGTTGVLENVPFEIEAELVLHDDDPPEVPGRIVTFQQLVSLKRQQIYPELNTATLIDFLEPPEPKDYVAYTPDQIITGIQVFTAVRGNGTLRTFVLVHNLGTPNISCVLVRENATNGAELVLGTHYSVTFGSDNYLTITLLTGYATPATNGLIIAIQTAGPKSAFESHTHTIGQIVDLEDRLDAIDAAIALINERLPTSTPIYTPPDAVSASIVIPESAFQYPSRLTDAQQKTLIGGPVRNDPETRFRPNFGVLLGAIHDATETNASVLPTTLTAGEAYAATAAIVIPGGSGHKSANLKSGDHFACDGVQFYKAFRDGTTKSYFPDPFERNLFTFGISADMLRQDRQFQLTFDFEAQTVDANSDAQYFLIVEAGIATSQTTPATTSPNLDTVTWNATPMIQEKLILSEILTRGNFGFLVKRGVDDGFTGNRILYGASSALPSGSPPTATSFVIRARLSRFDTENAVGRAKGAVWTHLLNARPIFL